MMQIYSLSIIITLSKPHASLTILPAHLHGTWVLYVGFNSINSIEAVVCAREVRTRHSALRAQQYITQAVVVTDAHVLVQ